MTGGRIVILGDVGRNFAAGMSGGVVWIYRPSSSLTSYIKNIPTLLTSELASSKGSPDHFDQEFWAILKVITFSYSLFPPSFLLPLLSGIR